MDIKELAKKCKLNDEELQEFYDKWKDRDHSLDHKMAARTLTSPLRRQIMEFIGYDVKTMEELMKEFNLDEQQLRFHLDMLEQPSYLMDCAGSWKLTPRGIGFLENASLE